MDDPLLVSRRETVGRLGGVLDGPRGRQRAGADRLAQRVSLEQLGDDVGSPVVGADVEDDQDVGVVQGAGGAGLELEPA